MNPLVQARRCPVCHELSEDGKITCGEPECKEDAWMAIDQLMAGRGLGDDIGHFFSRIHNGSLILMRRPPGYCSHCATGSVTVFVWCKNSDAFAQICPNCGHVVHS